MIVSIVSVVFWLIFWVVLHFKAVEVAVLCLRCFRYTPDNEQVRATVASMEPSKRAYLRRVLRAQVYYMICSVAGLYFLYFSGTYPWGAFYRVDKSDPDRNVVEEILTNSAGEVARFLFAGSVAHWALAGVEDICGRAYLSAFAEEPQDGLIFIIKCLTDHLILGLYLIHHVVAGGCYAFVLSERRLSALGCMGLFFELPVIVANIREFIVGFEKEVEQALGVSMAAHLNADKVTLLCCLTQVLLFIGRYTSMFAYIWSIIFWRRELLEVPVVARRAYHTFAIFFWCLVPAWHGQVVFWGCSDRLTFERNTARRKDDQRLIGTAARNSSLEVGTTVPPHPCGRTVLPEGESDVQQLPPAPLNEAELSALSSAAADSAAERGL